VGAVGDHPAPFPLVFQHGDPGAWNALATPDGGVAFLDWEAADPCGMPLWDLLYFLRSYGVGAARATGGPRDALSAFTRVYLEGSALADLLADTVGSYCARIGLDPRLVAPLYHLCWVQRAVKEATRLPVEQLGTGHYVRLLRRGLQQDTGPELRRLLTGGGVPVR
jgi:aminoglycoside phosphotransferase (APT) family kinase protein